MTKKTKRQFHCQRCGLACEIYKKGKKHRVLVCPSCGVLATNPIVQVTGLKNLIKSKGDVLEAVQGTISDTISEGMSKKPSSNVHIPSFKNSGYPLNQKVHDALK